MAMTQERKRDFTQHWSSIKPMILNVKPIFQWPFQEPIDWRYRFHIFLVYFSGLNFKIQDSQDLSGANLESNHWIQDSRFPGTLWSKSWIQPQDSRFKIPRNSLEQILNPTPGFKIQDSQELFGANLESNPRIQDSRFPGTLWSKSWIHLESWIQDFLQRVPGNLESWILDSRFAGKSPQESWILNLESRGWIQDLDSRFAQKSLWESWILNPGFKICWKESVGILNLESIQLAMALQRHCKLDRCQRSQGSKKVGLGGGYHIYIYIVHKMLHCTLIWARTIIWRSEIRCAVTFACLNCGERPIPPIPTYVSFSAMAETTMSEPTLSSHLSSKITCLRNERDLLEGFMWEGTPSNPNHSVYE